MKKIVAVLLVMCFLIPSVAMADENSSLARSAKQMIEIVRGQKVPEYAYSYVLGLLLVSIAENNNKVEEQAKSLISSMISVGMTENLSSYYDVLCVGRLDKDVYLEIINDAQKCYQSGEYNFDVLEKHIDYLIAIE